MRTESQIRRFGLIASLYVSQAIPLGFFIVAVPAILRREGLDLSKVGLLGALALPWLFKFLWAPVVDRFGTRRRPYGSWILVLQTVSVLAVVAISQIDLSTGIATLVAVGAVFMLTSATQDIATDGLAVRILSAEERGPGNGVQVGGYYLGQVLGGGLFLVFYATWGWRAAVLAMAAFLALPLVALWGFREPSRPEQSSKARIDFAALRRFVRRPGGLTWAFILVSFRAGEGLAVTMLNPMLVDGGWDLETIGVTLGVVGSLAALAGALIGGSALAWWGRKRSLVAFGSLQAVALLGYAFIARTEAELPVVMTLVALAAAAGGMATAALYTNMMDRCGSATAATDFTLQQSLAAMGPMFGAIGSGYLAKAVGYANHFVLSAAVLAVVVGWVALALTHRTAAVERANGDLQFTPN